MHLSNQFHFLQLHRVSNCDREVLVAHCFDTVNIFLDQCLPSELLHAPSSRLLNVACSHTHVLQRKHLDWGMQDYVSGKAVHSGDLALLDGLSPTLRQQVGLSNHTIA
jgi:hypothetical protein